MKEIRQVSGVELRQENGKDQVVGWGAVFGVKSRMIYEKGKLFYEQIERGAFDDVLARIDELNVIANRDHDNTKMLARSRSKTLSLSVDEKGLRYEFTMPNTTLGNDTKEMMERGDLNESSFAFTVDKKDEEWTRDEDGIPLRKIKRVSGLYDVAIVGTGAYPTTDVSTALRGLEEFESNERELAEKAKEQGNKMSKQELDEYYTNIKNEFYG